MPRCPVCESVRIVIVVNPKRRAFCTRCGARWQQDQGRQQAIHHGTLIPLGARSMERRAEPSA